MELALQGRGIYVYQSNGHQWQGNCSSDHDHWQCEWKQQQEGATVGPEAGLPGALEKIQTWNQDAPQ